MQKETDASSFFEMIYSPLVEILGEETAREFVEESGFKDPDSENDKDINGTRLISELGDWLSRNFDSLTAKGLLIRVGRSSLTYLRRLDEEIASLGNIDNRLKPVERRFNYSLDVLGCRLHEISGFQIKVDHTDVREYMWKIVQPDHSGSEQFLSPYLFFGLLEEFCVWLDSRKDYQIFYQDEDDFEKASISILIRDMR